MTYKDSFYTRSNQGIRKSLEWGKANRQTSEDNRRVNETVGSFLNTEAGKLWAETEEGKKFIATRKEQFPGLKW